MSEYNTTFNYLLSHKVIPQSIFSNVDFFYESIIVNPQNLQIYLQNVYQTATAWAQKYPGVEPAFSIDKFEVGILGESPETGIVIVVIPNCKELNDCSVIAIPCMREHARYFTCELSDNPLTGEKFYIIGEWKPHFSPEDSIWNKSFTHTNYGPIASGEEFISKVIKIVYGVDYDPSAKSDNSEKEDEHLKDLSEIASEGWMAFQNNQFDKALDIFNKLLDEEHNQAIFYHCRAEIHKKLAASGNILNNYCADYDMFRAKLADLIDLDTYSKTHEEIGLEKRTALIESENSYDILQNSEGKMLFCIKNREGDARLPELFYSGGNNALLRRRMDQYIVLDEIHKDAREELGKIDEVLVTEYIPESEKTEKDKDKGVVKEYTVPVRHLHEAVDLDSIEEICDDGYTLFASLAVFARVMVGEGKTISEVINKDDFSNLAAILAREEDYPLLEKLIGEGLSLDAWTSFWFKKWRPTPLFYITLSKIWPGMKEPEKMLAFLVKHGADTNTASADGDTPLFNQCLSLGKTPILKALLDNGADPNLLCVSSENVPSLPLITILGPSDYNEETKIFQPITPHQVERARLLVEAGADVNSATGRGETPLGLAIAYGAGESRQELIVFLRNKGADVNAALKGLENCFREGIDEYGYALYEFYCGFPGEKPMPGMSTWLNKERGQFYLEQCANNGYPRAMSVLGVTEPPSPSGRYYHGQALKFWNEGKKSESFTLFKEAFNRCSTFPNAALLPMPVSDYLKEFCRSKGWLVYQRLSIDGVLFPLLLIGDKKVVVTLEASSAAAEKLFKAAQDIRANYRSLMGEREPKEIAVIPAALFFAQDWHCEDADIRTPLKAKEIDLFNTGSVCGNKVQGLADFEDFIEQLGQQEQMPQDLNDMIHTAVIAVIDGEGDEQDEYDDGKYDGEV